MINTMVITKMIRNGVMASSLGQVETITKEITKETCEAAMVKCIGLMVATIRASG